MWSRREEGRERIEPESKGGSLGCKYTFDELAFFQGIKVRAIKELGKIWGYHNTAMHALKL